MNVSPHAPDAGPAVVAVRGEVDLAVLARLPVWLGTVFDPPGRRFRLDLTAVSFLDCAGLQALLAIEDHAGGAGGSVEATGISAAVARLLELLELPAGSSFLAPAGPAAAVSAPAPRHGPPRGPDEVFSSRPDWSPVMSEAQMAGACDRAVSEIVAHLIDQVAGEVRGAGTEMLRLHVLELVRAAADRRISHVVGRAELLLADGGIPDDLES